MTSDEIAALRELHKPVPPPPCRECGRTLSIARTGGGQRTVWVCDGKEIDPADRSRWRYVEGRPESMPAAEWEHYRNSRWEEPNRTDGTLMRALDALEASQAREARYKAAIEEASAAIGDLYTDGPLSLLRPGLKPWAGSIRVADTVLRAALDGAPEGL